MNLTSVKRHVRCLAVGLLLGVLLITLPLSARTVRIYVTNYAGDTVSVIDPETNKVVQTIEGVELSHGIGFSPDGRRVYLSSESENVLDLVDQKTGRIIKQVPLSGRPNTLAVSKDGRRVFVGIVNPGALDVIDTTSLERVKSIPMEGGLHDIYVTPDGKYVVAGSLRGKYATVVDVQTAQPVWQLQFGHAVRPMAFTTNPDGSTRQIFVQLGELHGFAVVDFATHTEVATIKLPDEPSGGQNSNTSAPSHGIGITPDGKTLWVASRKADAVFVYSLPDLKLLGHVLVGVKPEWITITPDSKRVYVSNDAENTVSAIDAKTLKEIARIPVGQGPRRMATYWVP
jgi:YVTN family beta-propeller protein